MNDSYKNAKKEQSNEYPERNPGKPHGLKQKKNELGSGNHAVQNKQIQTAYNNVQKWLKYDMKYKKRTNEVDRRMDFWSAQ